MIGFYQASGTLLANIWTLYGVAVFAISGFAVANGAGPGTLVRLAMTAGFVVFSIGHYSFVCQTISMRQVIEKILDKVEVGGLEPIASQP